MKQVIKIKIECGEHTCASEPGKFCGYAGTVRMSDPICFLFHTHDKRGGFKPYVELDAIDGWTQRCQQCKELTE